MIGALNISKRPLRTVHGPFRPAEMKVITDPEAVQFFMDSKDFEVLFPMSVKNEPGPEGIKGELGPDALDERRHQYILHKSPVTFRIDSSYKSYTFELQSDLDLFIACNPYQEIEVYIIPNGYKVTFGNQEWITEALIKLSVTHIGHTITKVQIYAGNRDPQSDG